MNVGQLDTLVDKCNAVYLYVCNTFTRMVDNLTLLWTLQYLRYYLSICLQYFLIQMVDNVPLWWTVRYQPSAKFFDATVDTA